MTDSKAHQKILIYSDLDGSLLDHYSYSHQAADPLLSALHHLKIPVIPVTSKTRAELLPLRRSLNNNHPFIIENGAAVCIPQGYFQTPPAQAQPDEGFLIYGFSKPRSVWLKLLEQLREEFTGEFVSFSEVGTKGIVEMTGLTKEQAALANQREFSEPVKWLGSETRLSEFTQKAKAAGANILRGGRFIHITGQCDKGLALKWLTAQYQTQHPNHRISTVAAGDGENDLEMLEAADQALLIRSPAHSPPTLKRTQGFLISKAYGPEGWSEGVSALTGIDPSAANPQHQIKE